MTHEIKPAIAPRHLRYETFDNMPIEEPRYVGPESIMLSIETGELFVDKTDIVSDDARDPARIIGLAGIMRVAIFNETYGSTIAHVADLRSITSASDFELAPPRQRPADEEEAAYWDEARAKELPIAAIAYLDEDPSSIETQVTGDPRYTSAAQYLAKLSDKLLKTLEKEESKAKSTQTTGKKRNKSTAKK